MDNYDDVLEQLTSHGLLIQALEVDGRMHRCRVTDGGRERRGWYVLHELPRPSSGSSLVVGAYGIYQANDPGIIKVAIKKAAGLTAEERAAMRARLAADRKRAKAAREREHERAANRAANVWRKVLVEPPSAGVDYLDKKGVQAYGLRYTESGALVVPMQDTRGKVWGLQFILPSDHARRKKLGRNKTYWPAGLATVGRFHMIGNPANSRVTLVTEGYATAATLFAATGLPVVVAFSANNLQPVAQAIAKAYRLTSILICADDDYLTDGNPGQAAAAAAALAVGGAYVAPEFPADRQGAKLTDFNDLQQAPDGGLHLVSKQIEDKLAAIGWSADAGAASVRQGGGDSGLKPLLTIDEAVERYTLIYGGKATLFDAAEHMLVPKSDVLDVLPDHGWRDFKLRTDRQVVRMEQVGFDPAGNDASIKCNLWGGWPTRPEAGDCEALLELLSYLCSNEQNSRDVYQWVLRWLAYPLQNPGAKLKTALVFHGPQGVGKNLFFEAVMRIYGEYGRIVDQSAVEDRFNDWCSRKLFMVCDEVVARMELYHLKNKLKALVTGDSIRINPKNVSPHDEVNHVNLVFLSNEKQPLVLERDDRRYAVIWVPSKLPQMYYDAVGSCIKNGGIEALHDYLLNLDLGDFRPWSQPPMTEAKAELVEVSLESTERFVNEWIGGELDFPFTACGSMDLYSAYRKWAAANGVNKPRESNHFLAHINKLGGWSVRPCHVFKDAAGIGETRSQKMVIPADDLLQRAGQARNPNDTAAQWATNCFFRFRNALFAAHT